MIRLLNKNDYNTWLTLAKEVEPLFGPMVQSQEFQNGIKVCIKNKDAYGIEDASGTIAGIIAINRAEKEISWLAVGEKYRGYGYGEKLIKKAIDKLEIYGDIFVQTFASGIESGTCARHVYEKNGFIEYKNAGKNPAGLETILMIRKK